MIIIGIHVFSGDDDDDGVDDDFYDRHDCHDYNYY